MRHTGSKPEGGAPSKISASTRQKVTFFGALNLKSGCLLTKKAATFNGETFGEFLHHLLQHTQGKLHVILDNAGWHKARDLANFFAQNQDRWALIFLPPCSPERVWRITRRQVTHHRYFDSTEQLTTVLTSHFTTWEQPNNALKALCAHI